MKVKKKELDNSTFIILIFAMILLMNPGTMKSQDTAGHINYKPIGYFHTDYSSESGAPRQGALRPDEMSTIEILPEYRDALKKLDSFEHIIVLYHLNESNGWTAWVRPAGMPTNEIHGLFGTRTPRRPNPIGFGVIKLHKIKNGILHISGADAYDGTPVLDIKPYIPSIDCPEDK